MKNVKVITAEEAARMIEDGMTISTGGFVSCACPEALSKAVEKRFLETGHPKDLTLFFAAGQGHRDGTGGDHYGHEGIGTARQDWENWRSRTRSKLTISRRALSRTCTGISQHTISAH